MWGPCNQSDTREWSASLYPPAVLQKALALVKEKWRTLHDYAHACEQLKSIRQDLTVQHARGGALAVVGLALFTLFSPELGLWVGTFHVIQSRTRVMGWHFSRYFADKTHQFDNSRYMFHVN